MTNSVRILNPPSHLLPAALVVLGLYSTSLYSYLLFHTLVELFSVLTAFAVFTLAWHTRRIHDNHYLLFIGIASLFTGTLDLAHTLAYKGMGVFPEHGANLATQFWIAFRFVFSVSFLLSAFFIENKVRVKTTFALYALALFSLIAGIFLGWFPACYIEGAGLTRFKILSEYAICVILLAALILLVRKRSTFDPFVFRLMALSLILSMTAEVSFTEYASVFGLANMLGHLFLLGSVAFIYRAIVVTGVVDPSNLLFRNLKQSEAAIRASESKYRLLFENMINGFAYHRIVTDEHGKPVDYIFLEVNSAFEKMTGLARADIIGKGVREVLPGIENDPADWIGVYGEVALLGREIHFEQHAAALDRWYSVLAYSPLREHFVAIFEDITDRKRAEEKIAHLASFPEMNPNPIMELEPEGRVTYINPGMKKEFPDIPAIGTEHQLLSNWAEIKNGFEDQNKSFLFLEVLAGDRVFYQAVYFARQVGLIRIYNTDITKRKKAELALQRSVSRFELLARTAGELLEAPEPQKVIDSLCRRVMEHLECDAFFNFLVDEKAGRLHLNAWAGIPEEEARRIEWLDFGVAVCGCAARDGRRIVAEKIPTTPDERTELVKTYGIKAYACHPILGPAGKVIGTLSFGTCKRETFTEEDISLMKAVTDQVAVAMIRMRDEQALRQAHDELELRVRERTAALARANADLEQEMGVRTLAEDGLRRSEERFRASVENLLDGFAIFSAVRDDSGRIKDFRYEYVNEAGCRLNHRTRDAQVGHTLLELLPAHRDTGLFKEYVHVVETGKPLAKSQLLHEDTYGGGRRLSRAFDFQAVKLGDGFAVVWRDVSDLRETERRIALTNELLKLYTRKFSRKEYLDVAVELIRDWSGCKYVGIRMLSEDGYIPYASCVEFSPSFLESENMLSIASDQCACIRIIREKPESQDLVAMTPHGSFYTNDSYSFVAGLSEAERDRFRGVCVRSGFQSIAVVPIRYREKVCGAIHLADEKKDMVQLRNIELFEQLALILGEALFRFGVEEDLVRQSEELAGMNEQLRNLSAHVDAVREGERMSIAREIHDELGQVLTAIKMDVSWLRKRLSVSNKKLADKAAESVQTVDAAIQSVKRISAELRPGILDDIGLSAAIEWAAKDFEKRTRITCTVSIRPETISVDRTRSTALFRILQESLTNIMRHASASEVRVSLEEKNRTIVLTVSDNGKGIKEEDVSAPHSFGLIGMRERVQFLGGEILIRGVQNRGTAVSVSLPIDSRKQPDVPVTGQAV